MKEIIKFYDGHEEVNKIQDSTHAVRTRIMTAKEFKKFKKQYLKKK